MATNQPARGDAAESMSAFVQRRNREQAARAQAQAAGHQAYGDAIRAKLDLDFPAPSDVAAHGRQTLQPNFFETPAAQIGHPGTAESFIPVWGSGREALADLADGKPVSAAFNAGLAALDLTGIGMAGKLLGKAGLKGSLYAVRGAIGRPAKEAIWRTAVRDKMVEHNLLESGQEGHHWLIAQRHKWIPDVIRNHPANIHGMDRATHARLRHKFLGLPRLGILDRYWFGTPHWSKVAAGSAAGHAVSAAKSKADRK